MRKRSASKLSARTALSSTPDPGHLDGADPAPETAPAIPSIAQFLKHFEACPEALVTLGISVAAAGEKFDAGQMPSGRDALLALWATDANRAFTRFIEDLAILNGRLAVIADLPLEAVH